MKILKLLILVVLLFFLAIPTRGQGSATANLSITVQGGVAFSPSALSFGNQIVNTSSASQAITMQNNTGVSLTITSIVASAQYSESDNCTSPLAASATCTINVTFTPTALGSDPGTITVTDSGPSSPQTVPLSGTGTSAIVVTPVDALMNMNLVSPQLPGTTLSNTILVNGTAGSVLSGWGSSGTASNMQVG